MSTIPGPTLMNVSSSACSLRRATASAGVGIGWMSRGTPTATVTRTTSTGKQPSVIAISSFTHSMKTCRSISLSAGKSPVMSSSRVIRGVAATGFCTAAPSQETTPADTAENKEKIRYDELDNMLSTTGSALLGLTIGCARCHDHKFDPIPTRDYYSMLAAFTTSSREDASLSRPRRDVERWLQAQRRLYREDKMRELGLSEVEKFWLRQPEHFFVPIQKELYQKYGKALEATDERLHAWMSPSRRDTWAALEGPTPARKQRERTRNRLARRWPDAERHLLVSARKREQQAIAGYSGIPSSVDTLGERRRLPNTGKEPRRAEPGHDLSAGRARGMADRR